MQYGRGVVVGYVFQQNHRRGAAGGGGAGNLPIYRTSPGPGNRTWLTLSWGVFLFERIPRRARGERTTIIAAKCFACFFESGGRPIIVAKNHLNNAGSKGGKRS